jgi:bifunctional UDP-N-acetylglucosamine pyrophosphorylase/glucosamine-1-phosphate N-acetyltransferase
MKAGVTIVDPDSVTIDDRVQIAADVIIEPQTHLRGKTVIGASARIGPNSLIEDSTIGAKVTAMYSVILNSQIGDDAKIGPFAHIRQQTIVGEGCRVGNFVELKKSTIGTQTNVAHLSYLGDTTAGNRVNIGAGTITANYDGYRKHETHIGDGCKTGSNSVLVAPVTLGNNVTVAAGSTVTKNVPDNSLVIARAQQIVKQNWQPRQ